jgi:hypothetical protein
MVKHLQGKSKLLSVENSLIKLWSSQVTNKIILMLYPNETHEKSMQTRMGILKSSISIDAFPNG